MRLKRGAVIISDKELQAAYQEIRDRYEDDESFFSDMEKIILTRIACVQHFIVSAGSMWLWN